MLIDASLFETREWKSHTHLTPMPVYLFDVHADALFSYAGEKRRVGFLAESDGGVGSAQLPHEFHSAGVLAVEVLHVEHVARDHYPRAPFLNVVLKVASAP